MSELGNLVTVADYLHQHGYSAVAAAGVAACIAGESSGNPEAQGSGGRGLIGWTPPGKLPDSAFTGNVAHDLIAQAQQIINYNNNQGAGLVRQLNQQHTVSAAADFYSRNFERPARALSDVRLSIGQQVLPHIGKGAGNLPSGIASGSPGGLTPIIAGIDSLPGFNWIGSVVSGFSGTATGVADVANAFGGFVTDFSKIITWVSWLFQPANWVRIVAGIGGLFFLVLASVVLALAAT